MQAKSNKIVLFLITVLALFLNGCGNCGCSQKSIPRKPAPVSQQYQDKNFFDFRYYKLFKLIFYRTNNLKINFSYNKTHKKRNSRMQAKFNKATLFLITVLALFLNGCGNCGYSQKSIPRKPAPVTPISHDEIFYFHVCRV